MENLQKDLVCPICGKVITNYNHIIETHIEFWSIKGLYNNLPKTVEEFNKRFELIGLNIKEL